MRTRGWLICILLVCAQAVELYGQATEAWYIRRTPPEPWTWCPVLNTNITEMDNVFGIGGWNSGYFTTVVVADAFGPDSKFVFLEGGDNHAIDLKDFLVANITTIENWVYNGGCLFLNAAPNEGADINFGFDGTTLDYTPPYYDGAVVATDPTHPIFIGPYTPVGTSWTGNYFCHAKVTGTCLTMLIDDGAHIYNIACEKHWGAGTVIFGGMTVTGWQSPFTQARNLRQNILSYLYNYEGVIAGAFTYPDSLYCTDGIDPMPIFDPGADTGTFTASPAGLDIDPETGQIDLSGSLPGTYTISNGAIIDCTPGLFVMTIAAAPKANFVYPALNFCTNDPDPSPGFILGATPGTFTATPAGMVINPATGTIDLSASTPGVYSVTNTVTTPDCGSDTHTVTVTIKAAYDIVINANICSDETYTLPDGTVVATTGTYVNNFTTVGGCDSVMTTNLVVHAAYATTLNVEICDGETYVLPDGTIAGVSGTYVQNFPTAFGCDSVITTNLTVHPVYNYTVNTSICNGDAYTLPDGTTATTTGIYVTPLLTGAGCDSVITTNLLVFPTYAVPVNASICSGELYTLPDGTTTGLAGTYITNLLTIHDCDSIITTTLTVDPVYNIAMSPEICEGETFILPDGNVVSATGTYVTAYTTVDGCDSLITTNLTVHPNPDIIFSADDVVCMEDGLLLLNAYPAGGTYSGTGISGSNFDPALAGIGGPYDIQYAYTDIYGCSASSDVFISVDQNFADAWGDTTIYAGEPAVLHGNAGGDYTWSPPTQVVCTWCPTTNAYPDTDIIYTLTSVNDNGCVASDFVTVIVLPNPGNSVFIPNSFTPNGDNANDFFFAYGYNLVEIRSMSIYDRWGELIFYKEHMPVGSDTEGWDGYFNSEPVNEGVYAYIIEITFTNDVTTMYKGNITVIR
ncbi:MAG: gliding motility-associated C-terminal domain-containing protein [Chitinophagales bacterium]